MLQQFAHFLSRQPHWTFAHTISCWSFRIKIQILNNQVIFWQFGEKLKGKPWILEVNVKGKDWNTYRTPDGAKITVNTMRGTLHTIISGILALNWHWTLLRLQNVCCSMKSEFIVNSQQDSRQQSVAWRVQVGFQTHGRTEHLTWSSLILFGGFRFFSRPRYSYWELPFGFLQSFSDFKPTIQRLSVRVELLCRQKKKNKQ